MDYHADREAYRKFTNPQRVDKALRTLEGIFAGVTADGVVNATEVDSLKAWMMENGEFSQRQPFDELLPLLRRCLCNHRIDDDEVEDIKHFCRRMRPGDEYFDAITNDMQRLHGIMGGIAADGQITMQELDGLSAWLDEHEHLKTIWPYDEVVSLLTEVRRDKVIDDQEHALLRTFFSEFSATAKHKVPGLPMNEAIGTVIGLCAVCPEVSVAGKTFCFTGSSRKVTRDEFADFVRTMGGVFSKTVTKKVDYLVIGADGNPCWTYSCYGRKVEQAIELRKAGGRILIVHENDFWDAAPDGLAALRSRGQATGH
jgi:hypothetical protein